MVAAAEQLKIDFKSWTDDDDDGYSVSDGKRMRYSYVTSFLAEHQETEYILGVKLRSTCQQVFRIGFNDSAIN